MHVKHVLFVTDHVTPVGRLDTSRVYAVNAVRLVVHQVARVLEKEVVEDPRGSDMMEKQVDLHPQQG